MCQAAISSPARSRVSSRARSSWLDAKRWRMKCEADLGGSRFMPENFKEPDRAEAFFEWEKMGYSKGSSIEHQMEWSIMEVLLDEDLDYVGTSNIDFPGFPEDIEKAKRWVAAAKEAREAL